jgi:hypothetical protein
VIFIVESRRDAVEGAFHPLPDIPVLGDACGG